MCAVSRHRRMASSVTSLSGAARTKLPASADEDLDAAVAHGPDRVHRVESVGAGRIEAELLLQGVEERVRHPLPDAHRAVALHVAVPAHRAGPGCRRLPMLPRSIRKLTISRMVGTPCSCCVTPIAQQTMTRSLRRTSSVDLSRSPRGSARSRRARRPRRSVRACWANSSKPLVLGVDEVVVQHGARPGVLGLQQQPVEALEEGEVATGLRICRNRSAIWVPRPTTPRGFCGFLNRSSPASGSGLTAMMRAPLRLASSSAESRRGWLVPGFCPTRKIRSAWWMSSRLTVPLPVPRVSRQGEAAGLVAHVAAVGQVVRAEGAGEELQEEGGLVADPAGGVEDRLVGRVQRVQLPGEQHRGRRPS